MGLYLKIDGVEGGVTHEKHLKSVEISGCNYNINRLLYGGPGAAYNREGVSASFSDLYLSKRFDKASLKLKQMALSGKIFNKAEIHFVTGVGQDEPYLVITLSKVLLSNYATNCSGGQMPVDNFAMNFTDIEWKFTEYDANNKAQSPIIVGFDLANCKVR